jgi:thiol-disulfide isomerase/thioredoxin
VSLTLPWVNGIYREFPLTVEYGDRPLRGPAPTEAPGPTTVATLAYNFNLVFAGAVEVDGRPMRLEFYPLPMVSGIDPATIRTFLDANQNGELDRDAGEMDTGRGRAPVFRAGRRFLAVKSVDLATGAIVVEERPASEYTRFDAQPGQTMPDFSFTDFEGKSRRLSDLRGKLVLLDFWGTWCMPCIEEMKHLDPVYAKYRARGFEIISLNMEKTAGKLTPEEYRAANEKARAFIAKAGHAWLQATQESIERVALDVIHVNAYPTCILLDREGRVISRDARGDTLVRLLDQHLPTP